MWKITFTHRARKDLLGMEKAAASHIIKKAESARLIPEKHFEKLPGFDHFKLGTGDHRIIAILDFKARIIDVQRIGHRKSIYEKT